MKRLPPSRIWLAISMIMMLIQYTTYSQHLGSARAIGLGAFTSLGQDLNAIDWNPAGLTFLKDWDIEATSFYVPTYSTRSLSLQAIGVGKRVMNNHAAALRISPGSSLEFVVPATFTFEDSAASFVTSFDKRISYTERYALGYAVRISEDVSLGMSAHYLEEKVTDTKYSVDTNYVIHSEVVDYSGTAWTIDWGLLWLPDEVWRVGVVAKNLFRLTETPIAEEARQYSLQTPKSLRFGLAYSGVKNLIIGIDGDTEKQFRIGGEWIGLKNIQLRSGLYVDGSSSLKGDAVALGLSGLYQAVQIDVSYLKFFSQANRNGQADINTFQRSSIENIEYNQFTGDRISLSAKVHLGRTRESLARIEYVEIMNDVFPASQPIYAFRPIGKARVRNTASKPIEAKVSFYVDRYMDAPTESKPYNIAPGDVLEIPFYAVFNNAVRSISSLLIRDGNVFVNASPMEDYDDRYQTRLLIHGRNDWNGDALQLKYFITPDDPEVLKLTRNTVFQHKAFLDTVVTERQQFERAKIVFDEFAKHLSYINDPKKSQDFVQYPSETLNLHGGDCDDISVCYSSLLASMGMATAFIDVIPPDHPENSHIYMMFDTGIAADNARALADNPKRYIVRKNQQGNETLWIPVETTAISKGFDEAWSAGAKEYFDDVDVRLARLKGWLRVIDFELAN